MKRQTHIIDATGKKLGRLASNIVKLLTGKHKPEYKPNQDLGDIVQVENIANLDLDLKKMEQKIYYRHSGYPGGLKQEKLKDLFKRNPAEVLRRAVRNMLPKNKLRKDRLKRLIIK